jgi:hypothetical protein
MSKKAKKSRESKNYNYFLYNKEGEHLLENKFKLLIEKTTQVGGTKKGKFY